MLELSATKKYKKSLKRLDKSGAFDKYKLIAVINQLLKGELLDQKHKDHGLNGVLSEYRDCHIENDLILIYKINKSRQTLTLYNIGSHSDLFG